MFDAAEDVFVSKSPDLRLRVSGHQDLLSWFV